MFYRQFSTPRSLIAQSDSKIACQYHFRVDYDCAGDILFSSLKMRECPPFIYSIIFNMMYTQLEKNNKNRGMGGVTNN